jgi:hypothetical protein
MEAASNDRAAVITQLLAVPGIDVNMADTVICPGPWAAASLVMVYVGMQVLLCSMVSVRHASIDLKYCKCETCTCGCGCGERDVGK